MAKTKPQAGPGETAEYASAAAASGESRPNQLPPGGGATAGAKGDCGCGGGAGASGGMMGGSASLPPGVGDAAPSLRPPEEGAGAGITAWLNNKRITGLWTINQNRNSWVAVDGVGWKKLVNNSDSAIVALTVLGSHAREKNSVVNYREEADGMIREMYVW